MAKSNAHNSSEIERALKKYALRVFITFVREAKVLVLNDVWTADHLEAEARAFLRHLVVEARYEKGRHRYGSVIGEVVSHWGDLLPGVQQELEQSAEWREFRDILLDVAQIQANRLEDEAAESTMATTKTKPKSAVRWEDVTISFTNEQRVQITIAGQLETANYHDMGFADRRSGNPNHAWILLRTFAQEKGAVPIPARDSKQFLRSRNA